MPLSYYYTDTSRCNLLAYRALMNLTKRALYRVRALERGETKAQP